jgi:CysZ protein
MPILTALMRSLRDVFRPRLLAVLFLPMVGAIILWSVLAYIFWNPWSAWMQGAIDGTAVGRWLMQHGAGWANVSGAVLGMTAVLVPAVLITAVIITEAIAMPVIVSVASGSYPRLEKRHGGTTLGSIANACIAVAAFVVLWIVSLPLWLTGVGALILPALNSAYLQQRLFRYDALSEHASREEYRELVRHRKGKLYLLGVVLAGLYYVPFVQLVAPVVSGLAFTHYCLSELAAQRPS